MDYYEIRTLDGKKIEGGTFSSDADAVRWYLRDIWPGYLYKKCGAWFKPVPVESHQ